MFYIKLNKPTLQINFLRAYNSVGRVPVLQTGCHRFESAWAQKFN